MKTITFWTCFFIFALKAFPQQIDLAQNVYGVLPAGIGIQVGTSLPTACTTGAVFFKSNATAGANWYGCTSTNTWTVQSGSSSGGASLCQALSSSGTTETCTVTGVASYTTGLPLIYRPLVASTGAYTINVNTLGAKSIIRESGNALVSGELQAGLTYLITYNGTAFMLDGEEFEANGDGSLTINRGVFPHTIGATSGFNATTAGGNTMLGYSNFSGGQMRPPETIIGSLPSAAANAGKWYMITDGASSCDATTGSGSTRVLVVSTGSAWTAPNCGTGTGNVQYVGIGAIDHTGDTTLTNVLTVSSIPALAAGDAVRFSICFYHTGSGGTWNALASYVTDVNGVPMEHTGLTTGSTYTCQNWMTYNVAASSQVSFGLGNSSLTSQGVMALDQGNTGGAIKLSTADMSSAWDFFADCQLGDSGDTCGVKAYSIEILRKNP